MPMVRHRRFVRNENQYELFEWNEPQRRFLTADSSAVRMFSRQGFSRSTSRLLAELAGYPREAK